MPSLVTGRSEGGSGKIGSQSRILSRVHSMTRKWDDDEDKPSKSSQDVEIPWSSSPARAATKVVPPPPRLSNKETYQQQNKASGVSGETPADRRRKAILEAMSQNTSSFPPSASSTQPSSSMTVTAPAHPSYASSSSVPRPLPQVLPDLRTQDAIKALERKRPMPWEETSQPSKRSVPPRTDSRGSNKSDKSTSGNISIRAKVVLSPEQQKVLQLVVNEGKNVFFTGSAGTGKSVLLREIIKSLRKKYVATPDAVAVTASTGIAACNIGGITMHSFGGAGLCVEDPHVLVGRIRKNKKASARWLRTKVLIIDEVSMVDADLFDKFCKIGQILRKKPNTPFGGIQIIVTGDFFQLPPVTKGNSNPRFCFEATMWEETINMSVNLSKVFRQKDPRFVDMLNEMRFGRLTTNSIQEFRKLSRAIHYDDGIEPTELFPRREDVERANNGRLNALNTDGWSYVATDGGEVTDPAQRDKLLGNFMATQQLMLKVDAQVMLIKNMDETLVNGSMGKIIGFCHKATFEVDSAGRWKPEGDLDLLDDEERERKIKLRDSLQAKMANGVKPFPVVQFKIPGGGLRDMLIEHDTFKSELPNGQVQVSRHQLPLILAWAMSIHKSQGQTLDRVKVDLSKVFEKGQAYVALSRATSLEGLQVMGFNADKVMAHKKVAIWSAKLRDLNV